MKFIKGFSIKGRIAGKLSVKKQLRNRLGLKAPNGLGFLTNPEKFVYNKVYNKVNKRPLDWLTGK